MSTSNPYFRTFISGAVWFFAVAGKSLSQHAGSLSTFPSSQLLILAFISILTALLLGVAASRFEKLRSWWAIGLGTVAGWFIVAGLMLIMPLSLSSPNRSKPSFNTTGEMMVYLANEATKWVKQDRNIDLDYSVDSIKTVEEELGRISKTLNKENPPKGTFGTALGYGAYVGEVLRRRDGGSWVADDATAGQKSYPLTLKSNTVVFPVTWCWKRLINGEEDNVYHKAMIACNPKILSATNIVERK